jgi:hypothetical protein
MRIIDSSPISKTGWLAALIQKRSRRGWWAYVIWLLIYAPTVMMFAGDTGASPARMWPFLIPVAILSLQLVRPTILIWAVISLPTFLYLGIYWTVVRSCSLFQPKNIGVATAGQADFGCEKFLEGNAFG